MLSSTWQEDVKNWLPLKLILCESGYFFLELLSNNPTDTNRFFSSFRAHQQKTESHKAIQLSHIAEQINDADAPIKLIALCSALFNPTFSQKIKNALDSEALKKFIADLLIQGEYARLQGVETNTLQSEVFSPYMLKESISHCLNCDSDEIIYDKPDAIEYMLTLISDKIELDSTAKKLFDTFHTEYSSQLNNKADIPPLATITNNERIPIGTPRFGYNASFQTQTEQVVSKTSRL